MSMIFDIETVRKTNLFTELSEAQQKVWMKIRTDRFNDFSLEESYKSKAGLFPEFNKIVCISMYAPHVPPFFVEEEGNEKPELKFLSAYGDLEEKVLREALAFMSENSTHLVGHGIKRFDIPNLIVKCVQYNIEVPYWLRMYGVKPWESNHIDTYEVWKGGNFSTTQAASLDSVCAVLGIESPKDDIDGSEVSNLYWSDYGGDKHAENLNRIKTYCEKDVRSNYLVFKKMQKLNML